MVAVILTYSPHRASGARASHLLDIVEGLVRSVREDRPVEVTTSYGKQELFTDPLAEG